MTSAEMRPARGRAYAEGRGYGLVLFAGVLLLVSGFWNLIYGIAAIANSHVFVANAHYVFGSLRTWGWITLIFAILLLIAGGGVMAGNQAARWFAVAVDHRIREVGEPLIGRRCRREHRRRVVGWANLHQDGDGQRRDDRYFPGHEEQIYGG